MFGERAEKEGIEVPFVKAVNTLLDGHLTAEDCARRIVSLS
jgi:hypothetical protein